MTPADLYDTLVKNPPVRRATAYLGPQTTMKLTRQRPKRARERQETFILTVGQPNYAERQTLKKYRADNMKFPVLEVEIWPRSKST